MLTEEVITFIEILYERVPCQKTKNVWSGQTYNEAA